MSESIQDAIKTATAILRKAGAEEVYLFGSAATGASGRPSDIDLAVKGLPATAFFEAVGKVAMAIRYPFDIVDVDEASPFTDYLQRKGKLVRVG